MTSATPPTVLDGDNDVLRHVAPLRDEAVHRRLNVIAVGHIGPRRAIGGGFGGGFFAVVVPSLDGLTVNVTADVDQAPLAGSTAGRGAARRAREMAGPSGPDRASGGRGLVRARDRLRIMDDTGHLNRIRVSMSPATVTSPASVHRWSGVSSPRERLRATPISVARRGMTRRARVPPSGFETISPSSTTASTRRRSRRNRPSAAAVTTPNSMPLQASWLSPPCPVSSVASLTGGSGSRGRRPDVIRVPARSPSASTGRCPTPPTSRNRGRHRGSRQAGGRTPSPPSGPRSNSTGSPSGPA